MPEGYVPPSASLYPPGGVTLDAGYEIQPVTALPDQPATPVPRYLEVDDAERVRRWAMRTRILANNEIRSPNARDAAVEMADEMGRVADRLAETGTASVREGHQFHFGVATQAEGDDPDEVDPRSGWKDPAR